MNMDTLDGQDFRRRYESDEHRPKRKIRRPDQGCHCQRALNSLEAVSELMQRERR
jgi:hypothetical protein